MSAIKPSADPASWTLPYSKIIEDPRLDAFLDREFGSEVATVKPTYSGKKRAVESQNPDSTQARATAAVLRNLPKTSGSQIVPSAPILGRRYVVPKSAMKAIE